MKGKTYYYEGTNEESHSENDCDKCGKSVGKANLKAVPFLYCNVNDTKHPDVSHLVGYPAGTGYRQYYVCSQCYDTA